jgi:hypothetical protein
VESRVNEKPFAGSAETFYSGVRPGQVMAREGSKKRPLTPRVDLHKHSSTMFTAGTGFAWGTTDDAGPAQLSLALLADALGNDARALQLHQRFNHRVVTMLPERWTITRSRILAYADMIEHLPSVTSDDI